MNRYSPEPAGGARPVSAGAARAARMRARNRNRRPADWLGIVRTAALLLVCAQVLRVVFTSERFALRDVQVVGSPRIARDAVLERGRIPLGRNIFAANLSDIAGRLRRDPELKQVQVIRLLPTTLRVELTDRTPALHILTSKGRFFADEDGVVFRRATGPAEELPQAVLPAGIVPPLGQKLGAETLATLRECRELAEANELSLRFTRIDGAGEVWLNVGAAGDLRQGAPAAVSGLKVRVGRPTELPEKFRDIRLTLAALPRLPESAEYLDVMCPGFPSYRKKEQAEVASSQRNHPTANPNTE